jgi:hypothetical protein
MSTRCSADVPFWKRERFWPKKLINDVVPKWTSSELLAELGNSTPIMAYTSSSKEDMTMLMLINTANYEVQFKFSRIFYHLEMLQAQYV